MNHHPSFEEAVRALLDQYFADLDGAPASALYEMVIQRVERTLFEYVLIRTHGNITQAADLLGIARNTLRPKPKALYRPTPFIA